MIVHCIMPAGRPRPAPCGRARSTGFSSAPRDRLGQLLLGHSLCTHFRDLLPLINMVGLLSQIQRTSGSQHGKGPCGQDMRKLPILYILLHPPRPSREAAVAREAYAAFWAKLRKARVPALRAGEAAQLGKGATTAEHRVCKCLRALKNVLGCV